MIFKKTKMKLIVGLGNPGERYKNSRHNLGFMIIDYFCKEKGIKISKKKFNGIYERIKENNQEYIILKPMSYMNNSGEVVYLFASYFAIEPKDILIVYDDKDILFNKYKISNKGSSAGHNGVKDILKHLDKDNFTRLRCGIGPVNNKRIEDFVMDDFLKKELKELDLTKYLNLIYYFLYNE
ncbi:MAG: peptidyl-tRNA hydrolase [Candidatus Hepatoplasma vulgare]|nr:MAG: peptidyl-tRNA hydrolase [Candidatus Hepatoplasma sp.]